MKICGVTRLEDALLAVQLGAWAVGMIFYADSPRRCSPEAAVPIAAALRRRAEICGVFVDESLERVCATADQLGLTMVQLHGNEGPAYCAEVSRRTGALVCKAAQVSMLGDLRDIERFHVDLHLLDARPPASAPQLRGGTGRTFDWSLVAQRRSAIPLIMSGGLDVGNVAAAIAATSPYAVDTASGTERSPGVKDPELLRGFLHAVVGAVPAGSPA